MKQGIKFFIVFTLLFINTVFAQKKQYNTSITLSTDKTEYILYENIFLNIKIENFDNPGPKIVSFSDITEYCKVIRLEDNTTCKPTSSVSRTFDTVPGMTKGQICDGRVDMLDNFGTLVNPNVFYLCLPVGSYKVSCEYRDPTMYDYEPIKSNDLIFYIREGVGEEKEVKKLFEKCLLNIQENNFTALNVNTQLLAKNYYNSMIFGEVWRVCMMFYIIKGNNVDKENAIQKLIDTYHNHQNSENLSITLKLLMIYSDVTGNKEKCLKSLDQLVLMTSDVKLREKCENTRQRVLDRQ